MGTLFALLAGVVLMVHLAFVFFVVAGGFWVASRPWLAAWHLPACLWGAAVELFGWRCPLTPLEQWLWRRAGEAGYEGGFVDHYLVALLYPQGLTRGQQLAMGMMVVVINLYWYARLFRRRR